MLRGDRAGAERILDEAIAHAENEGMITVEAYLRHESIRAGLDPTLSRRRGNHDSQRWNKAVARPSGPPTRSALATGMSSRLADAAKRFAELGHHLRAAEAFAAGGAVSCYRHAGSPSLAAQALRRAIRISGRCSGTRTPALRLDDSISGLTSRRVVPHRHS